MVPFNICLVPTIFQSALLYNDVLPRTSCRLNFSRGRRRSYNIYKPRNSISGQKRKSSCVSDTDEVERFCGKPRHNIHFYLIDFILYFKERRPGVISWPSSPSSSTSTKLREKVRETGLWGQLTRVRRQLKSRNSQQSEHLIHPEHYTEEDQEDNMITRFKNIFSKNI